MSLLYYLLNRGIMSLETMSPSAMGIRTYSLLFSHCEEDVKHYDAKNLPQTDLEAFVKQQKIAVSWLNQQVKYLGINDQP